MTKGHFCDPEANAYPPDAQGLVTAFDCITTNWTKVKHDFPIHDMCTGKTVVEFGPETELIVKCDCSCHQEKTKLKVLQ